MVLSLLSFTSCNHYSEDTNMITYETGVYSDKNWSQSVGTYNGDAIPNKETALAVAQTIFNSMNKSQNAERFVPQHIFYDTEDEIWIVSFWQDTDETVIGNDCNIALQKSDGKVLRIWFGE